MATSGYIAVEIPEVGMIFRISGKEYEAGDSIAKVTGEAIKVFTHFYPINDEGDRTGEPPIKVDHDFVDMVLL